MKTKEKGDSWWIWIVVGVVGWSVVSRGLSRSQNERVALERRKEGKEWLFFWDKRKVKVISLPTYHCKLITSLGHQLPVHNLIEHWVILVLMCMYVCERERDRESVWGTVWEKTTFWTENLSSMHLSAPLAESWVAAKQLDNSLIQWLLLALERRLISELGSTLLEYNICLFFY